METAGRRGLDRDTIKLFAALCMLPNHCAEMFLREDTLLRVFLLGIGYAAAFAMCFFLSEGFRFTSSRRRYGERLFIFALLSEIPYYIAFCPPLFQADPVTVMRSSPLNMIWTLFLSFLILEVCTLPLIGRPEKTILIVTILFLSGFSDWGVLAPLFVLLFSLAGPKKAAQKKAFAACLLLFAATLLLENRAGGFSWPDSLVRTLLSLTGPAAASILILFYYNGQAHRTGTHLKFRKWFFYIFYPAHLAVLDLIRFFLFS